MKTRTLFVVCFLLALLVSFAVPVKAVLVKTATNPSGDSVSVWTEKIECELHIFVQYCDGEVIWVSDNGVLYNGAPSVAVDDSGNFVVVWVGTNRYYGHPDPIRIYFRSYSSSCEPGEIFQIKDKREASHGVSFPEIAIASEKFVICWIEFKPLEPNLPTEQRIYDPTKVKIWAQQFNADGTLLSEVYRVSEELLECRDTTKGVIQDLTATEEKISVTYRTRNISPGSVKTATQYWADIKPFVSISCQQEGSPGDYASLTVSPAITGRNYQVYYCDCLKDNCWSPLGKPVIAESNSLTVIDNGSAASCPLSQTKSRFYKVSLVP